MSDERLRELERVAKHEGGRQAWEAYIVAVVRARACTAEEAWRGEIGVAPEDLLLWEHPERGTVHAVSYSASLIACGSLPSWQWASGVVLEREREPSRHLTQTGRFHESMVRWGAEADITCKLCPRQIKKHRSGPEHFRRLVARRYGFKPWACRVGEHVRAGLKPWGRPGMQRRAVRDGEHAPCTGCEIILDPLPAAQQRLPF